MTSVTASIGRDHYKATVVSGGQNHLVADEPEELGGQNLGFAPDELLAGALATCGIMTMRMYADRKQWPIDSIEMEVLLHREPGNLKTVFEKRVRFLGSLTPDQQQRLLAIGEKCPVHKTLVNPIDILSVIA
jgi:putative redox protein